MNDEESSDQFPRYSEKEILEYVVQYRNTVSMRTELILELYEDLKKVQVEGLTDE